MWKGSFTGSATTLLSGSPARSRICSHSAPGSGKTRIVHSSTRAAAAASSGETCA